METQDIKKEQILDAAMHCMARYGIHKSTMDDVASVLGMKKASLYYYYKNKEALFIDALEREAIRLQQRVIELFKPRHSAEDKLKIAVKTMTMFFKEKVELLEFNVQAMVEGHSLFHNVHVRIRKKNLDFLAALIKEGIDKKEFRNLNPQKMADALRSILDIKRLVMLNSLSSLKASESDFTKMEKEALFMLDLLLNGMKVRNS